MVAASASELSHQSGSLPDSRRPVAGRLDPKKSRRLLSHSLNPNGGHKIWGSMDENNHQTEILKALEALKTASKDIEANSDKSGCNSPSLNALLELEIGSVDLLSGDPKLTALSSLLSRLKSLSSSFNSKSHGGGLRSFLRRHSAGSSEISLVAGSIGSELQSWIDHRTIDRLISPSTSDDEKSSLLSALESRLSQGFDREFQDLLLRSGVFAAVESLLADPASSKKVRDRSATAILAFVRFNKDMFVGEVLMGPTVRSLVTIASATSLPVLNGLIASIRSPLVDGMHADGGISKIIGLLSPPVEIEVLAFDTVLEIGYFGRKEAVEEMIEQGLIKKLVELQRLELGGSLMAMEEEEEEEVKGVKVGRVRRRGESEKRFLEARPFTSCVSRFSIQMEVGEGLRQREKRALKLEVLRRVREVASSDAEVATIVAEVLWGSTSW